MLIEVTFKRTNCFLGSFKRDRKVNATFHAALIINATLNQHNPGENTSKRAHIGNRGYLG